MFTNVLEHDTDAALVWFQTEVLQESKMMIHDSHRRLVAAHGALVQLLVSNIRPKLDTLPMTRTSTRLLT